MSIPKQARIPVALFTLVLLIIVGAAPAAAQSAGRIQVLTGRVEPEQIAHYRLAGLQESETLFVYVRGASGNLDPFVGLVEATADTAELVEAFNSEVDAAVAGGADRYAIVPALADEYLMAWNDDGGEGYDATLEFTVPATDDYQLLVLSTPAQPTFGDYELTVGIDAPQVLEGGVEPTGHEIAQADVQASRFGVSVQQIQGTLTAGRPHTFLYLNAHDEDDTLYIYVEPTSGDLVPAVLLRDFGGKPIASHNVQGKSEVVTLEYTFTEGSRGYSLDLSACCDGTGGSGSYRLLAGIDAPEVLEGQAELGGRAVMLQPIDVHIGMVIREIGDIDQKEETFSVVADLRMEWNDPALAFNPDDCRCDEKVFRSIDKYVEGTGARWPEFAFANQLGVRRIQNELVLVRPDGSASFFQRSNSSLSATDLDFRDFPFDSQILTVRIDALYPTEVFLYSAPEGLSSIDSIAEEEEDWIVSDYAAVTSVQEYGSRFSLAMELHRNLTFYIVRIFVPLVLIIVVAWVTFFLKDYGQRIEVTSANLLVFITFNFTISDDLPRLGYLTFLDAILIATFIISALVIVLNVALKRLEAAGRRDVAERIDRRTIWIYPVVYLVAFSLLAILTG